MWQRTPEEEFLAWYSWYYPFLTALADGLLFALLAAFQAWLFPHASPAQRAGGLALYLASSTALWPLLYTRMDLVLALLLVASLFLLVRRVHYLWSFALLAAAINFKVVPVVLIPVWLLGSLPAEAGRSLFSLRTLGLLAVRSLLLVGLVVAIFAPFYWLEGPGTLGFLAYHRDRGLEVGSTYSSLLVFLARFGHPVQVYFSHGGYNLRSPLSPWLLSLAPSLAGAALLAATGTLLFRLRRLPPRPVAAASRAAAEVGLGSADLPQPVAAASRAAAEVGPRSADLVRTDSEAAPSATLAQSHPFVFIQFTFLLLLVFMATNKVFSPQYLLWAAPFVCLLPWQGWQLLFRLGLFPVICLVTTAVFPFTFQEDILGVDFDDLGRVFLAGPSLLGAGLMILRNVLFVGLTGYLFWSAARESPEEPRTTIIDPARGP
jgi:hypothetical protein